MNTAGVRCRMIVYNQGASNTSNLSSLIASLMPEHFAKIGVSNNDKRPRVVWVEPWGGDFTLLPSESLEIHALCPDALPWFSVIESDSHTQVYVQMPDPMHATYDVYQGTEAIRCGHNRQAAVDAGIYM